MAKKKRQRCVYCNDIADTRDHVPPKGLFPRPHPNNLISVPCRNACNHSFAADDQYFCQIMPTRHEVGDNPAALEIMNAGIRGLLRPQARGFRNAVVSQFETVQLMTQGGIYLGEHMGTRVDYPRFDRVVRRIVRGLHFREHAVRLARGAEIVPFLDIGFTQADEAGRTARDHLLHWLRQAAPRVIKSGVFQYWHRLADNSLDYGAWLLLFYGQIWFLVTAMPAGSGQRGQRIVAPPEQD